MSLSRALRGLVVFLLKMLSLLVPKLNIIVFTSEPDVADNSLALYQKIVEGGYKYHLVWLVSNKKEALCVLRGESFYSESNTSLFKKTIFSKVFFELLCKYHFDTHGAIYLKFRSAKYPVYVSLWHGSPIKSIGRLAHDWFKVMTPDFLISGSVFFSPLLAKCLVGEHTNILEFGFPRNDWLLKKSVGKNNNLDCNYKYIVWMPTFRQSMHHKFDDGDVADGALSFLAFDKFPFLDGELLKRGVKLIIKLHPFDLLNTVDFPALEQILVVKRGDAKVSGSGLYSLLADSSGIITDYSSIMFDYMLTGKPIGIDLQSCSTYKRPLLFKLDASQFNHHEISSVEDILSFVDECCCGALWPHSDSEYNIKIPFSYSETICSLIK